LSGIRAASWDNAASNRFEAQQYRKIEQQTSRLTPFNKHGSPDVGFRPPPPPNQQWNQSIQHGSSLPFIRQPSDPLHKNFDHVAAKLASTSFKSTKRISPATSSVASTQVLEDTPEIVIESPQSQNSSAAAPLHVVADVIDYEHSGASKYRNITVVNKLCGYINN
jgi:hypothetical protein